METRASYLLVGAFALIAMAGFAIAVVWMAGVNLREESARYDIYFRGSVSGLKEGNAVRYRGIPVGVVTAMEINPENVEEVRVTIEIPEKTPVKADTIAALEYQGITGVAYVELSGGTHQAPLLEIKSGQERPVIPSKSSQLQELFDTAPELVTRVTALVDRISILLKPENQENISRILDSLQNVTGMLAEHSGEIGATLKDAHAAAKEAELTLREIGGLAKTLQKLAVNLDEEFTGVGPEAKEALTEVRKTATEFKRAAVVLADLVDRNKEPVNTFAASGLYELTQLLAETRVLVGAMTRISSQIERDPARFLFGKSQPGVEVK